MRSHFLQSVQALRYMVAASFLVAAISGATSVYLTRQLAQNSERLKQIHSASADSAALYAEGLQMCQATRNIVLDPANPAAHRNHAMATKEFKARLLSLQKHVESLFPGSEATSACRSIEADFEKHLVVQKGIHDLSKEGAFERAKQELNSADTPLWRKYKQTMQDSRQWLSGKVAEVDAEIARGHWAAQILSWVCGLLMGVAAFTAFLVSGWVGSRLRGLAGALSQEADQLAAASNRVRESSQSLAGHATHQAAALEETAASTQEISAMARRNGEHSRSAAGLVQESQRQLSGVVASLDETVAAIAAIDNSSSQISRIIKAIDDIAFQTNILALNAAVEAARAGEAGLGFAVVAGEVGNLAQRCAQAAHDTTGLIEASITRSRDGKAKVDHVAQAVRGLAESSNQLGGLVHAVTEGTQQQSEGVAQIAKAVTHMERSTQKAVGSAQQDADAAADLARQAEALRGHVGRLNSAITGRE